MKWKPKTGNIVWYINLDGSITQGYFDIEDSVSIACYKIGVIYKTKMDAQNNKDEIMKMYEEIKKDLQCQ